MGDVCDEAFEFSGEDEAERPAATPDDASIEYGKG